MPLSVIRRIMLVAAFIAMSAAPPRAKADLIVTLDQPSLEITLPTTGSLTVDFTGSATGGSPGGFWATVPFSIPPNPNIRDIPGSGHFDSSGNFATGTVLVELVVASSATPTVLDVSITIVDHGSLGGQATVPATLTIDPPAAAPEPSTALVAVFGAAAFIAYGWSRQRRDQRRQAAA
jgi:hypothetical protein